MPQLGAKPMHVPAGLPINQAARPEHVNVGEANITNSNIRLTERGAAEKRLGFAAQSTTRFDGTSRTAGHRLCTHGTTICTIDGTYFDSYSEVASRSIVGSRVPDASVSVRPLSTVDTDAVFDFVQCNGYIATACLVGATNQSVVVSVETTEGIVVRSPETVFTGAASLAIASLTTYGSYMILLAMSANSANIAAYYLDTTSPASVTTGWVSIGNVATDKIASASTTAARNCSSQSLTDRIAFTYVNNSGGASQVTVTTITIAGVSQTTTVNTSSATPDVVSVEGSAADTLWICWNETTTGKLKGLTATSLSTVKATTAAVLTYVTTPTRQPHVVSDPSTAGAGRILATDIDSSGVSFNALVSLFTTSAGAVTAGATATIVGGTYINRPFAFGGRYYAIASRGDLSVTNVQSAVVSDWTDAVTKPWFRPVANAFPDLAQVVTTAGRAVAHHWAISATQFAVVITVKRSSASFLPCLITLDFADIGRWEPANHNHSTFISGGILSYYDGRRVAEAGFVHAPNFVIASLSGTGITGTFSWVFTFEEVDNDGNWSISSVSTPRSGSATNQTVNLSVRPLCISARLTATPDPRVRVSAYRTTNGGAAPYYYVGSTPHVSGGTTFSDNVADATLVNNRLLLGTGNLPAINGSAQDHRAPSYADHVVSYNGMLVYSAGSNIYWSGQTVDGEGTWFSPIFSQPVGGAAKVTGLAAQDGSLYAFSERTVFVMAGEPPSDNASSGGIGTPRQLAVDVGCISGRSIAVCSAGIFFQSNRGIELLTRAGAVQWIGEQVQDTLAAYPVVTSAVLDDKQSIVRFTCVQSVTSGVAAGNGRTLVYDVSLGAWVSEDNVRGSVASEAAQDGCMATIGGVRRYEWLGTDGVVHYEKLSTDSDAYLDGSSFVVAQYEMPAWKLGLQQEQRVYEVEVLFERFSAAGLTIEVAHDYDGFVTAEPDKVWTESAIAGKRQVELRPRPRGAAVRFRVRDTAPAVLGTGRGFSFIGMTSDIAPKQGPTRGTPRIDPGLRR